MAMKVKIRSVHGHGDYDKEYVILDVEEDCEIGHYLLADTSYMSNGEVSSKLRHFFWFPDKPVKRNSVIVLYTKPGLNHSDTNNQGTRIHYFYWGLKAAVWNDRGDCAALIEANAWQFKRAK